MKARYLEPAQGLPKCLQRIGYSSRVQLNLKKGEICSVYGISIWSNVLHYLVFPTEEMLPSWIPAEFFEIVDQILPLEWYIRYSPENNDDDWRLIIGYKELALDPEYYKNLVEKDRDAIRVFLKRKEEIDNELSNG